MKKFLAVLIVFFLAHTGFSQATYTFIGNGNWSDAANWDFNGIPPATLLSGSDIIINPAGECKLDIHQTILNGASLTVIAGKKFTISGDLLGTADFAIAATGVAANLATDSALVDGAVLSSGGTTVTERGICYATHASPDTTDNVLPAGSGMGSFSVNITNLLANTTYYYVAYAVNSMGISYGSTESFTTVSTPFVCGNTITVNHTIGDSSPVVKTVTYETVKPDIGGNTACWITKNLGADQQATSYNDTAEASAGWYFQFNRKQGYKHDGTTRTPSTNWIIVQPTNTNWSPASDPCTILGAGWHIPGEWNEILLNWNSSDDAFQSVLKVHAAGNLDLTGALNTSRGGTSGLYWTVSKANSTNGYAALITSLQFPSITAPNKLVGLTLRCTKAEDVANPLLPTLTTTAPTTVTDSSAATGGNITADGGGIVTARGICMSSNPGPTIANSTISGGSGNGSFNINLSALLPNRKYYVRAYAINSAGAGYGNEIEFTTEIKLPTVMFSKDNPFNPVYTNGIISITVIGNVRNDGGNAVSSGGFVYGTNDPPNITGDSVRYDEAGVIAGNYFNVIEPLLPETKYYIRSFATNSVGTAYSEVKEFTTPAGACSFGDTIIRNHNTGDDVAPEIKSGVIYQTRQSKISGESKCWIIQNLGADHPASSASDPTEPAAGWYWQFGKKQGYAYSASVRVPNSSPWVTGYQLANWSISSDPCHLLLGEGWRIPTNLEWTNAFGNWSTMTLTEAYNSVLKLHDGGYFTDGDIFKGRGTSGLFWSSYQDNNGSNDQTFCLFGIDNYLLQPSISMFSAGSIRCLKD